MKKYKAAFLSHRVIDVYSEEQKKRIAELTDLKDTIVTPDNFNELDLSDVEVIFSTWGMMNFSDEQFEKMPNLKAVFYAAGATDSFARALFKHNVKLSSAWRANAIPVAEFTVAQIVLSMKNYFSNSWTNRVAGPGCYGETVALLGAGEISTKVQELLKAYNLNVIVVPSRKERRTISMEEVFKKAYVVSNHLPNRDDNKKVITREMFESMRHGATFINTGRGAQVDEEGMIEVLKKRPDLTALLDVLTTEPPPADSELYKLPNIRMSGHIAGSLNDEFYRMADYAIDDFLRFANGEELQNEVTESILITS